jgi:hypothetical protein
MDDIKTLFKILIDRYDKVNSISVGITPNGQNVIYKKMKITDAEIEFMKEYLKGE